jgi:alpha-tubulin suppressor-like RCC1 family protein
MAGCGEGSAPNWRELSVPAGTYMESIASTRNYSFGIDQEKNLWEWGAHPVGNRENEGYFFEERESSNNNATPVKIIWFKNNEKTVLTVATG